MAKLFSARQLAQSGSSIASTTTGTFNGSPEGWATRCPPRRARRRIFGCQPRSDRQPHSLASRFEVPSGEGVHQPLRHESVRRWRGMRLTSSNSSRSSGSSRSEAGEAHKVKAVSTDPTLQQSIKSQSVTQTTVKILSEMTRIAYGSKAEASHRLRSCRRRARGLTYRMEMD